MSRETKGRYSYPYGDFGKVRRGAAFADHCIY